MADKSTVPGQVTFPGDASKGFTTDKDGVVYPEQVNRTVRAYLDEEGSMGFNRNQGVVRDDWGAPEPQLGTMGQSKLQRLKQGQAGSRAI